MNIFRKIGSGFKWLGGKILWVIKREETLFAISLASGFLPIPALDKVVFLVRGLDRSDVPGTEKMLFALEKLPEILRAYNVTLQDEAEARLIIEIAVAMMKKRARVIPKDEDQ